jgi:hypothetical protein
MKAANNQEVDPKAGKSGCLLLKFVSALSFSAIY